MATTKISALPAATTADVADLTIVVTDIGAGALQDQKATVTQAATYSRALTGATTASAIVGSGASLIINTALADSDTRIAGTTSANLFFVDAGLDKVGIATAVPTQKLDVTGTVNATLFAGSGASLTGLATTSTAFRTVATDPSPLVNGDVWYNSTSDTFKGALAANAWASTTSLPVGIQLAGACGTTSAALSFGGDPNGQNPTYAFNGTAWSSGGNLITARYSLAGCGTTTAALGFGGYGIPALTATEKYNGTTWSSGGNLATGRFEPGGCGTQTAGFCISGRPATVTTETFNGTSWSAGTSVNTSHQMQPAAGTTSSAVYFGVGANQTWNGSSWANGSSCITSRDNSAGCGVVGSIMVMGGSTNGTGSETNSGGAWSSLGSLVQRRTYGMAAGTSNTSGMTFGGTLDISPYTVLTAAEIYGPVATAKTFTVA